MANSPQSIDEAMGIPTANPVMGKQGAQSPPDDIASAMGISPPSTNNPISQNSMSLGRAVTGGMARGLSLGYSDRFLPDYSADTAAHPYVSAAADFIGSIPWGEGLGKLMGPSTGAGANALKTGAQGLILGGASDPGAKNDGPMSRLWRAGEGVVGGTILGGMLGRFGHLGEVSDVADQMKDPELNYAQKIKDQIDAANQSVRNNVINPAKSKLNELLNGKNVDVDQEELENLWERRASPRPGSPQLPQLSEITSARGLEPDATNIPASDAQALKEYFDSRSNYGKNKPFDSGAVAGSERDKRIADYWRGQVAGVDPQVNDLNSKMSEAIRLIQNIENQAKSSPLATIMARSPDKAQLLQQLDRLAGTDLSGLGEKVSEAAHWNNSDPGKLWEPGTYERPLQTRHTIMDAVNQGIGKINNNFGGYVPEGARAAFIESLLNGQKSNQ